MYMHAQIACGLSDSSKMMSTDDLISCSKSHSELLNDKNIILYFLGELLERLATLFVYLKSLSFTEFTRNKTAFQWSAITCIWTF